METKKTLLKQEDIAILQSFDEGTSGYFGKMLQYLEDFIKQGVAENSFTEQEAKEDLEIALWYSFACNNIDEYYYYYKAKEWMPSSEKNAAGCAMWYYRYSCALMHCGELEKALQYAEQGAKEDAGYPWVWLQLGKLRSHFGNKEGALQAVEQGLSLVPDDYEFLTLRQEIEGGASLEKMVFHWINPEFDKKLQDGTDEDHDLKMRTGSCLILRPEKLKLNKELFKFRDWNTDGPYCTGHYYVQNQKLEIVFAMNEAGVSNMNYYWLKLQKEMLDRGEFLQYSPEEGKMGVLETVFFSLNYEVSLFYKLTDEDNRYFRIDIGNENQAESNDSLN